MLDEVMAAFAESERQTKIARAAEQEAREAEEYAREQEAPFKVPPSLYSSQSHLLIAHR